MGERVTFIHSGDIHLGAPFRGLRALSPAWAQRLTHAIPEAFDRVIDACLENQVDFLLLAGDVFDTDKPSYAHHRHLIKGLTRLNEAGIAVYVIAGNHDPYANWKDILPSLPRNVRMFPSESAGYCMHRRGGGPLALIAARGFFNLPYNDKTRTIASGMTRASAIEACGSDAPFAIGMLHSGLWMDPYKAPATEAELMAAGMDYWALGHIHKRYLSPEHDPKLGFCGCIQGRDIKETGERGCFKITLEEGLPTIAEFIPTASVQWERLRVDVSSCAGTGDILARCVREMFDANAKNPCEEMVARISFVGATPLYDMLARPGMLEGMRAELNESYPTFFCDALVNETTPLLDKEGMSRAGLFPAALLSASSGEKADIAAQVAYVQEEFAKRGIVAPQGMERSIERLAVEAEDLVLSLLEGGEMR